MRLSEALKVTDGERQEWQQSERLDLPVELVPALELVLQKCQVLCEHELIFGGQRGGVAGEFPEPCEVSAGPVTSFAEDETAPGEELEHVVTGLHELALKRLSQPYDVANSLFGL